MHPSLSRSTPRSHIGSIHLRKINLLPVSERVESCIATVANILKRDCTIIYQWYIQAFLQKLYISLSKLNTEQQVLSFLGPKIWNISRSTENVTNGSAISVRGVVGSLSFEVQGRGCLAQFGPIRTDRKKKKGGGGGCKNRTFFLDVTNVWSITNILTNILLGAP